MNNVILWDATAAAVAAAAAAVVFIIHRIIDNSFEPTIWHLTSGKYCF